MVIIEVLGEQQGFIRIRINFLALIKVLVSSLLLDENKACLGHTEMLGDALGYARRVLFEMRDLLLLLLVNRVVNYS